MAAVAMVVTQESPPPLQMWQHQQGHTVVALP